MADKREKQNQEEWRFQNTKVAFVASIVVICATITDVVEIACNKPVYFKITVYGMVLVLYFLVVATRVMDEMLYRWEKRARKVTDFLTHLSIPGFLGIGIITAIDPFDKKLLKCVLVAFLLFELVGSIGILLHKDSKE